jgi:hypothetical protein
MDKPLPTHTPNQKTHTMQTATRNFWLLAIIWLIGCAPNTTGKAQIKVKHSENNWYYVSAIVVLDPPNELPENPTMQQLLDVGAKGIGPGETLTLNVKPGPHKVYVQQHDGKIGIFYGFEYGFVPYDWEVTSANLYAGQVLRIDVK